MRIEIEESALDSIKAMACKLQEERDELLLCLQNYTAAVAETLGGADDIGAIVRYLSAAEACRAIIIRCNSSLKVME